MSKLYAYVDESGKDSRSNQFIVASIVVPQSDIESFQQVLVEVELESRKRKRKWAKSRHEYRVEYFNQLCSSGLLSGTAYCKIDSFFNNELNQKCSAIAKAIMRSEHAGKAKVFIDGELSRNEETFYRNCLRRHGVRVDKVKGIAKSTDDPISRLADACCGLARANCEGRMSSLFQKVVASGLIKIL